MRVPAAVSTAVRPVLSGPVEAAQWLGVSPSALYLLTRSGTVLAILTHDAVRLPGALVLSATSAELPLTRLVPPGELGRAEPAAVGAGRVEWTGPAGDVTIVGTRTWAPSRVAPGRPQPRAIATLVEVVANRDIGLAPALLDALADAAEPAAQFHAVAALLGRGPGLTPSGDDVLAGFLLGARAFGRPVPGALTAVGELAAGATTALSAQLLDHARRGECVPEFAATVDALCGRGAPSYAGPRLLGVGHTSGAALALGLLNAATGARTPLAVGARR